MDEYDNNDEELNLWAQFAMLLMVSLNNTKDDNNKEVKNNVEEKEKR